MNCVDTKNDLFAHVLGLFVFEASDMFYQIFFYVNTT